MTEKEIFKPVYCLKERRYYINQLVEYAEHSILPKLKKLLT